MRKQYSEKSSRGTIFTHLNTVATFSLASKSMQLLFKGSHYLRVALIAETAVHVLYTYIYLLILIHA